MRFHNALSAIFPGTIARTPLPISAVDPSGVSRRSLALRFFSSGPWHAKQVSDKTGRTS